MAGFRLRSGSDELQLEASFRGLRSKPGPAGSQLLPRLLAVALLVSALVGILAPAPAMAASCTDTWNNAAGGVWETAANWSNGVPSSTDTVCIALPNITVTITGDNESAASLSLGGSDILQLT